MYSSILGKWAYGRYVIVQMDNGHGYLNLGEVEVFGNLPTTTTTTKTTTTTTTTTTTPATGYSSATLSGMIGTDKGILFLPWYCQLSKNKAKINWPYSRRICPGNLPHRRSLPCSLLFLQAAQCEDSGGEGGDQRHLRRLLCRPRCYCGDDRPQRLLRWGLRLRD